MTVEQLQKRLVREKAARQEAERLLNEKSLELYQYRQTLELALWASQEAIWHWIPETDTFLITRFKRNRRKDEFSGTRSDFVQSIHPDDFSMVEHQLGRLYSQEQEIISLAFRFYQKEQWRWLRMRGQATDLNSNGMATAVIGTIRDISEQQEQLSRLDQLARYDTLTGLLNRRTLLSELQKWAQLDEPFCLIFVDLDGFKLLNDTLGHLQGDAYLQSVADTLRRKMPKSALISRYGGDEFVCAFKLQQDGWLPLVQRLKEVRTPFNFHGRSFVSGAQSQH
jgi:GGDEF domain-containing protein